jgi:tetratricopeptide (TPR) repeat protein
MGAKAWEDEIRLTTYLLGPADPNPPWQRTGLRRVYPYPMLDDLTDERKALPYRALHIENEYLHAIVLPELGGHLYSLYDKVVGREVFYRNNVVKYGLVARRGAWISGGIEFNFPMGHTCVTVSPVQSAITEDPETGEARISIGYTERVCRMRCRVTLSLAPGQARLRQDVLLHNPRPVRHRHYFWANSAVPARDDLHLIYPCSRARTLGGEWPYPIVNGRDMSWYRNHERPNDIFALDVTDDFFGCYYEQQDVGLVHWSDHRLDFGKKFFTWGTADEGMIWVDLLTDQDGQYVEMQSGRFVDQSTWEFLFPYQTVEWTEYWFPLNGMGSLTRATDEAALDLHIEGDPARQGSGAHVAATVNRGAGPGEMILTVAGREVWRRPVQLRPGRAVAQRVPLAEADAAAPMSLALVSGGREVARCDRPSPYLARKPLTLSSPPLPSPDGPDVTPHQLCLHAIRQEKHTDFGGARRLYEKALEKDAAFSRAHLGLGIMHYHSGLLNAARDHLQQAAAADAEDDEALYYLALVLADGGQEEQASELLWRLMGRTACRSEAAIMLAKLAIRSGDSGEALRLLSDVPDSPTVRFLQTVASRLGGGGGRHAADPLAAELLSERYFAATSADDAASAGSAFEALGRVLSDGPEGWLELAFEYRQLGLIAEARDLLTKASDAVAAVRAHPMVHYLLADLGDGAPAKDAPAAGADPAYCFPSRVEEIGVLERAARADPADWKARLHLGNLLASLGRGDEALTAWMEGARIEDGDAVLRRNIALAHSLWREDHATALTWYAKAIKRRPDEYHLYVERDRCLAASGAGPEERLSALKSAPAGVTKRWEVAAILADCLVQLERWDEAVSLMQSHKFRPWEGARGMHGLWTQALVGRAAQRREAGDAAGGIADYELALTYPRNLGVGRSAHPHEAEVHYRLAVAAGEAGDEERRTRHLTAAAAEEHPRTCEADIYRVRALRDLGRSSEADERAGKLCQWARERLTQRPEDGLAQRILAEL